MKTELDTILREKGIAGIMVLGNGDHNPAMVYLTGGGHISNAILVKKTGADPLLMVNPMEREEAGRTGLPTITFNEFKFYELLRQAGGDVVQAESVFYKLILQRVGLTQGKVILYGNVEIGPKWDMLLHLQREMPGLELVSDSADPVLGQAMLTKDAAELTRIKKMGITTTAVVQKVADYIRSCKIKDETLYHQDGAPVTIGFIHNQIDLWLAELGAENPEGTIFSIGHDAGVPHSLGQADDVLKMGQTIVFDIYPCEKGGGYFYDFTRTWCIGYAPPEAQALYDQVHRVYDQVVSELKAGQPCAAYQSRVCDLYEAMGHPTLRSHPGTVNGYNHSVGHGVGLQVHEAPWLSANAVGENIFKPGMVFTMEPGLYYPDKGMGVRIEDTYYVDDDGGIHRFVDYPYDLVLPVKG
jgi:Xaa-Pro aminopeptidase